MSRLTRLGRVLLALALVGLLASPALAHVPAFGADNDSPDEATVVTNPTKSWAFYDGVDADGAAYYEATFLEGEDLSVTLFSPGRDVTPSLVLLTPEGETSGSVPAAVALPDGYGATVIEAEPASEADLEPFTPGAYFYTVSVERPVDRGGTYLLAIHDRAGHGGSVGIAIGGTEAFTPEEYLTVPIDALAIHAWEGDSPVLVFGPLVVVALAGVALLRRRLADGSLRWTRWALGLSGLAILGTTAGLATQLAIALAMTGPTAAALVSLALVFVPGVIAIWLWRVATAPDLALTRRRRLGLLLAGVGSLATWGGLLVAPLVPLGIAALPSGWLR